MILQKDNSTTFKETLLDILKDIDLQENQDVLLNCISDRLDKSLRLYDQETDFSVSGLYIKGSRKVLREHAKRLRRERKK